MQNKRNTTQHELDVIQANTCADAMDILGVSRTTIHNICRDNGITFKRLRGLPPSGKYANRSMMTHDWRSGMTVAEIARKYEMVPSYVRSVLQQKTHGPVFQFLQLDVIEWLDRNTPDGMTIYEYAAIVIREAYEEETE
jgi:hypothetical protein